MRARWWVAVLVLVAIAAFLYWIIAPAGATAATGSVHELHQVGGIWQTVGEASDDVGTALQQPTPLENWQIILAFAMPGIVEFFRKLDWTDRQKMAASFLITAIVTTVTLFLQGQLDLSVDYVTTVLKIFALTIPAYYGMWKPLGLAGQSGKTFGVR